MDAIALLGRFVERTHHALQPFNLDGTASESLKRVLGALTTHADVTFDSWILTLEGVLAAPWWGDGPASIGAIFGPRIVEDNLANPDRGHGLAAPERRERDKIERTRARLRLVHGSA